MKIKSLSKNLLAAVVAASCILGAHNLRADPPASSSPVMNATNWSERVSEKLKLSDEQKISVQPILEDSFNKQLAILQSFRGQPHTRQTLRALRDQMKSVADDTTAKLQPLLTKDQMKQYNDLREEMKAKFREKLKEARNGSE